MTVKIQVRRGLAANWTSANPTLSAGEIGFETDTLRIKIGDGTTAWVTLGYASGGNSYATTATAAGTTTFTVASAYAQFFTGSTTQTVVLPVTSTLSLGQSFYINNNSSGTLTVNSSGGNLVATLTSNTTAVVTCISLSGTSAASWDADFTGASTVTGTGSLVLSASPTFTGTVAAANLTLSGDLTVNGTTTTINSTTLSIDDKNIELGSVDTPTNTTADGGGLTLKGTTDKTFNWVNSTSSWTSSEHLDLATTKVLKIAGTEVLSGTTLGSGVTGSSLTSVGTITSGTWSGTAIAATKGGTGLTSISANQAVYGNGTNTITAGTLPIAAGGTASTSAPAAMATLMGYTSTATAAGTTTLTNTSSYYQQFTGVTTQTIVLPVTSTLTTGWTFHIVNNSTGLVTVNSSGGNQVIIVPVQTTAMVTCIGTAATTAADWESGLTDFSTYTGSGNVVMATSPTISGLTLTGSLTANSSTGTSGFVLTSTGSGVQWAAAASDATPTVFMLMGA